MVEKTKEVIQPLQSLSRSDYLVSLIVCTLTFVVYAFTAAPGVTLVDSGDYIMGVLTLGIVHAPGYPLYTVLGHLFSLLPFGEPAFRVNLFSALWGSLCLGVMFLILRILSIERTHAVFATLFLGFTTVFWSQTGIAEVYTFNAFLIGCIVFWILSYNRDKKRSQLYLIFLTTGLALSNHYPLVILTGIGLLFLLDRRDLHAGDLLKGLLFLGLGLTPYLYLFIQALNPELQYNFGKLSDSAMVVDHILRQSYGNIYEGTAWDKLHLTFTFLQATMTNFLFGSLFIFLGIGFSFLRQWKYRYPILLAALSPSIGLILILTFPSNDQSTALLLTYLIPSFLFLTVFVSLGLETVMNGYLRNKLGQVSLLVVLLVSQVGFNFHTSSHHNDKVADVLGSELLHSLRPNSIVILCDRAQFAIYYQQLIKGSRQDVTLYNRSSFYTKDNLYHPELLFRYNSEVGNEVRKRREQELINNSLRPIYYTCQYALDEQNMDFSFTPFGYRADKRHHDASDSGQFRLNQHLLDSLINVYPKFNYEIDRIRIGSFHRLISYYGGHALPEIHRILNYFIKTKFYSNPEYILPAANNLYYFKNYGVARNLYERAEELSLDAFTPTDLAMFCDILADAGSYAKALGICRRHEQSSAPCEMNAVKSRVIIAGIYKEQGNWPKVAEYSRKILQCQPDYKVAQRYLRMATERGN
ncbi:MAG: DUF2723 domain-containing protein, partial [Nitrososphaerales archaeon]